MREEGIYLSLVGSKEASDAGIVIVGGFFSGIQWKVDNGGNEPMREEGISIYFSLVRSKEASDVGIVVGRFFSGDPMKGGHWQKWTNERGGNFHFHSSWRDFFWHTMKGGHWRKWTNERGGGIYLSLVRSKEASDVGIVVGGFFSGHPMKGGHWGKWTNERGGNFHLHSSWRVFFRTSNERWTQAEMDQWERREFQFTSRWWGARKRAMYGW
jgi:hypothetical protein